MNLRSLGWYIFWVVPIGMALISVPVLAGLAVEPFVVGGTYLVLLGGSVITERRSGGDGRQIFRGALRWRLGWPRWTFVVAVLPVTTIGVAAITGSLVPPRDGWTSTMMSYLVATLLGTLVINLWEEAAWQGLVQRTLTGHFGMARAAMLTGLPFALLHVPLSFAGDATTKEAMWALLVLFVMAPPFRYMLGWTDRLTGESLLAVAVLHASFNASGGLDVLEGRWQHVPAVLLATSIVAIRALAGRISREARPRQPVL